MTVIFKQKNMIKRFKNSYVYWTVHHCDSWRIKRPTWCHNLCHVLFHFLYAQHVSDINTSINRSLQLFYCITRVVVCSCFDVCWSFGMAVWGGTCVAGWSCASACHTLDIIHFTTHNWQVTTQCCTFPCYIFSIYDWQAI